ncbi:ependymin [Osmerus mordax]|uniref:ependymin n=1 Tax=Osmerus mordax TaxID=8014 RepID=UPI0035104822
MHAATALFIWTCLGVTVLASQHRDPCQSPNLTGILSVMSFKGEHKGTGHYIYDHEANKLRLTMNETYNVNNTLNVDLLMLFEEGVFYEIDIKNQSCAKKSLLAASHVLELPPDAKFNGNFVLGSMSMPGEGVKINVWTGVVPVEKGHYLVSTSAKSCLPLSAVFFSDSTSLIFSNMQIETEIKEPEVFLLPALCEGMELEGTLDSFFALFD